MLSIVATLEEFRSMLLSANIHMFTNHKNLTFDDLKTQRVLRWRNKVKEFLPWLHYIKGPWKILADNLSRLLCLPTPSQIVEGKKLGEPTIVLDDKDDEDGFLATCKNSGCLDDDIYNIFECYLNLPKIPDLVQNPLSFACIREQQQQDEQLLALQAKYPEQYIYKSLDKDVDDIICYLRPGDSPDEQWRIALPQQMLEETVKWFHQVMGHPGEKRLRQTLQQRYYHSKLRYTIDKFKCEHCQWHKLSGKGYGLFPEREMRTAPWEEVAINLIGPWMVKVNNRKVEFNALTCIDTASNLVELIRIDNKT